MKKTLAILLALVLALAICSTAVAATLTIENAYVGSSYTIYKVLGIDASAEPYIYTVDTAWKAFFEGEKAGAALVNAISDTGVLTTKATIETDAAALAEAALAYAKANGITGDTVTAAAEGAVFAGLDNGYYLVDSPAGVLDVLHHVDREFVEAEEKHKSLPALTKAADVTSADVGGTVTFQITLTVEAGGVNYVVHDNMASGLTYQGVTSVKVGDQNVPAENYTVSTTGLCKNCDFHIAFADDYISGMENETKIIITYTAKVNERAVEAVSNVNSAWLTFGESETIPSETITYTGKVVIDKYDGRYSEDKKQQLAGAKFKLYNAENQYYKVDENGAVTWVAEAEGTEVVTDENGAAAFSGIADGTYYLVETVAPAGYNLLADEITVEIVNGAVKGKTANTISIANSTGSALPSTGGVGTTIFYVVGGLLMAAAVVLLVTKKKTSGNR